MQLVDGRVKKNDPKIAIVATFEQALTGVIEPKPLLAVIDRAGFELAHSPLPQRWGEDHGLISFFIKPKRALDSLVHVAIDIPFEGQLLEPLIKVRIRDWIDHMHLRSLAIESIIKVERQRNSRAEYISGGVKVLHDEMGNPGIDCKPYFSYLNDTLADLLPKLSTLRRYE